MNSGAMRVGPARAYECMREEFAARRCEYEFVQVWLPVCTRSCRSTFNIVSELHRRRCRLHRRRIDWGVRAVIVAARARRVEGVK